MPSCAVSTCKNTHTSVGSNSGITFHPFPRNEKEALVWFIKCKRRDKKRANASDRICSIHFQSDDYERDIGAELLGKPSNPKLKAKATPTLNLPFQIIKPAEARKLLPPSLAHQLLRSSMQCGGGSRRMTTPRTNGNNGHALKSKSDLGISLTLEESEKAKNGIENIEVVNHCQKLLCSIYNDEDFADVTLVAQNKTIKAHKAFLSYASGYFREVFATHDFATEEAEVKIDDVEFEDLQNVIAFIYEGKLSVKNCDLSLLEDAAKTLKVEALLREVKRLSEVETTPVIETEEPPAEVSLKLPPTKPETHLKGLPNNKKENKYHSSKYRRKMKSAFLAVLFVIY